MSKGGDWWSWQRGIIVEGIPRVYQGVGTFASLGYALSVFNENSTLKERNCNETFLKRRRGHKDMRQIPTVRDDGVGAASSGLRGAARRLLPKKNSSKMMSRFLNFFANVLHHERPDCELAVLLRRWWILRNNSTMFTCTNTSKS